MTIPIGEGETKNLIYRIYEKTIGILSDDDVLLFAIKDINDAVVFTQESRIDELSKDGDKYIFNITLSSELTNSMPIGEYWFDLTLIDANNQKVQLTKPKTIQILKTVGASIL